MALWLLVAPAETRRRRLPALGAIGVVGLALLPLISAQGARNTNWIGAWALGARLQTIPQYFLIGYNGAALGHGIELLVALPLLAACALGIWRASEPVPAGERPSRAARRRRPARAGEPAARRCRQMRAGERAARRRRPARAGEPAARRGRPARAGRGRGPSRPRRRIATAAGPRSRCCSLCAASAPAGARPRRRGLPGAAQRARRDAARRGADRVLGTWPGTRPLGPALLALGAAGCSRSAIDTALSPRLQRGDWRGLARAMPAGSPERAVRRARCSGRPRSSTTSRACAGCRRTALAGVREVVEVGEQPLPAGAGAPPLGFRAGRTPGRCTASTSSASSRRRRGRCQRGAAAARPARRRRSHSCSSPETPARRARLAFQHGAVDPGGSRRGSVGARGGPRASALAPARGRLVARRAADERDDGRRGSAPAGVPRRARRGRDRAQHGLDPLSAARRRDLGELPRGAGRPLDDDRGLLGAAARRRRARRGAHADRGGVHPRPGRLSPRRASSRTCGWRCSACGPGTACPRCRSRSCCCRRACR